MSDEPDRQLTIADELDDFGDWIRSLPRNPFESPPPPRRKREPYERRWTPPEDLAGGVGEWPERALPLAEGDPVRCRLGTQAAEANRGDP